ncbi:MAG: hypothetical protein M1820_001571 [Bogoriella megaspora]|nr:MAG: hypothetical protein M1820_001571 [Bogoriella megaspora]
MSLSFSKFCDLLTQLEDIEYRLPPLPQAVRQKLKNEKVIRWFKLRRSEVESTQPEALLSSLLPHRRRDRNYATQEKRLVRTIGRSYGIPQQRMKDLEVYKIHDRGDLGDCVERVVTQLGTLAIPPVLLEEVDATLNDIAAKSRHSNRSVRDQRSESFISYPLDPLYQRMGAREAKWLTRLVLKDIARFMPEDFHVLRAYHFLLPDLLRFQDSLPNALELLAKNFSHCAAELSKDEESNFRRCQMSKNLRLRLGVKIGRPPFVKARSLDYCLQLAASRTWSLERKYDGEYCEVHIDLTKGPIRCVQIYSKSGKDSTEDRKGVHGVIRECLRIGKEDCPFQSSCILLGELVVYSDKDDKILEFAKIRKHVARSGSFLGTENDSPAHQHEHLMVVFFDVLMIDDEMIMNLPYSERRDRLSALIKKRKGRAVTGQRKMIDFSLDNAREKLIREFASSVALRWEGIILRPADAPYFSFSSESGSSKYQGLIKLKRDYFAGMGEEADFAVVGASYKVRDAQNCSSTNPRWTSFYLGCLENKEEVLRIDARPRWKVVDTVNCQGCIPPPDLATLCELGQFVQDSFNSDEQPEQYDISFSTALEPMQVYFKNPPVVEILGSNFDKPAGANFYMLRHPRVRKVHLDRNWKDTVSFDELQIMAREALERSGSQSNSQELDKWVKVIREKMPPRRATPSRSTNTSPRTQKTTSPDERYQTMSASPLARVAVDKFAQETRSSVKSLIQTFAASRTQKPSVPLYSSAIVGPGLSGGGLQLPDIQIRSKPKSFAALSELQQPIKCRIIECPIKPKRRRETTIETASPSPRSEAGPPSKKPKHAVTSSVLGSTTVTRSGVTRTRTKEALADITHSPEQRQNSRPAIASEEPLFPPSNEGEFPRPTLKTATPHLKLPIPKMSETLSGELIYTASNTHRPSFPTSPPTFSNTVVYIAPCLRHMPYLTENLLSSYLTTVRVNSLGGWVRDRGFDAAYANTNNRIVYESQSYPGMQKMVFVESRREPQMDALIEEVLGLRTRERIEVWDWRVLEWLESYREGIDDDEDGWMQWYMGVVDWDVAGGYGYFEDAMGARVATFP